MHPDTPPPVYAAAQRVLTEIESDTSGSGRWLDWIDQHDIELVVRYVLSGDNQ